MLKTFTTVNEAVAVASEFGIPASEIAQAIGISRQNFHNKLKANGSTFTAVHVSQVNTYLEKEYTAVHERLTQLLGKSFTQVNDANKAGTCTAVNESIFTEKTFTQVNEPKKAKRPSWETEIVWNEEDKMRAWNELQKRIQENPEEYKEEEEELPY